MTDLKQKRYWAFRGSRYYPLGGMNDFYKASDNLHQLQSELMDLEPDVVNGAWATIYDSELGKNVMILKDVYTGTHWVEGFVEATDEDQPLLGRCSFWKDKRD